MLVERLHEARIKSKRKDVGTGSVSKNAYDGSEFWTEDGRTQKNEDDSSI